MMLLQVAAETTGITAQTWFITGLGFGMGPTFFLRVQPKGAG